jgi:iron complex transport system permease protein
MNAQSVLARYSRHIRNRLLFIALVMVGIVVVGMVAIVSGAAGIGYRDVIAVFSGDADASTRQIVMQIRMPRVMAALLAGFALSVSGAVMQSILRNPLASPFTLGISGAAAFGAAFAIVVLGAGSMVDAGSLYQDAAASTRNGLIMRLGDRYLIMGSAFVFSLAGTIFILAIARYRGVTPEVMVLSGIAIGSLFSAGVSAMQFLATEAELSAIVFWMFGDLGRASWQEVSMLALVMVPVWMFFTLMSWNYKALQSGDEYAQSLGVNPFRIRLFGMLVASLATAVVVSFYGIIAFVGLVVPILYGASSAATRPS